MNSGSRSHYLYVLRNDLALNGAKYGCGFRQCGACTVQVDGKAVFSCLVPVAALAGRTIRTVEGLGTIAQPSVLQNAGMIMRAQALLDANPHPDEQQIGGHMDTNLCRCGTHMRILRAIRRAAGLVPAEPI